MESYDKQAYSVGGHFHSALKHQMSAVVTMIIARKVRVNISDQSGLLLQSLGQLNEKPNPGLLQPLHNSDFRKYSIVGEQPEEPLGSNEIFPKYSAPVQPGLIQNNPGGSTTNINASTGNSHKSIPNISTATHVNTPESNYGLTQVPHFSVLPSIIGSQQKDSSDCSTIISQYLCHDQLHCDFLEISDGSCATANKTIMPSFSSSDSQKPSTELSVSGTRTIGFGILSRTRQFGAWLTKATEGEKVEVTKQDLNALAPNSF